jgi:glycosyltransferase involved in cell wall biosynthesis
MKTFCQVTLWWDWHYIRNDVSPHFFYYPVQLVLKNGLSVEVLTRLYQERVEVACETLENLQIHRFKSNHNLPSLSFSERLFRHMIKRDYSLIHLHNIDPYADHTVWLASRLKRTPLILTSHSPSLIESLLKAESDQGSLIDKITIKNIQLIKDSPTCTFIAFTKCQAEAYRKIGVKNTRLIPHGVNPQVFQVEKDKSIIAKYGLDKNNILCVGVKEPRKGQIFLIKAMPRILKEFPNTKLLLSGGGVSARRTDYQKELEFLITKLNLESRVVWLGEVPRKDLIQLYLQSSVFALPTECEMFCLVLLEAMAAGLPIVTTNRPYIAETLDNGKAGILVERKQDLIEKAILQLLGDKDLRKKMGAHGQRVIEQNYRLDNVIQKLWDLYKSFLE